jgi:enamine deaminase RidA (YjgF/YER057c/UK114 family)
MKNKPTLPSTIRVPDIPSPLYSRLKSLGITLPKPQAPAASYVMASHVKHVVYLSGHIAKKEGKVWVGQLGKDMTTAEGALAARSVAIDLLATLENYIGDLNLVRKIVRVTSLVNSTPDFTEHHLVTNGCSDLLLEIFDEEGKHARSAFGVAQLPLGACVEIEMIVEVDSFI